MSVEWIRADELMAEFNELKVELAIGSGWDGPSTMIYADSVAEVWAALERIRRTLPACREVQGTEAGWMRHYRAKQAPCKPCRRVHNKRTSNAKRRRGAYVDDMKVERFLAGDANGLTLNRLERAEVLRKLLSAPDRLTTIEIADRVGVSKATVNRHMKKLRMAAHE